MSAYYIYHDRKRCVGCYACEVHCKTAHDLPVGPRLNAIIPVGPHPVNNVPRTTFVYMHCYHCEEAPCVQVCPTGAMQKRVEDGIVFVDDSHCIGCKSCISACEWGAPQWDAQRGKVVKCDYCMERIDEGKQPACVTKCAAHALRWLTAEEASQIKRRNFAEKLLNSEE